MLLTATGLKSGRCCCVDWSMVKWKSLYLHIRGAIWLWNFLRSAVSLRTSLVIVGDVCLPRRTPIDLSLTGSTAHWWWKQALASLPWLQDRVVSRNRQFREWFFCPHVIEVQGSQARFPTRGRVHPISEHGDHSNLLPMLPLTSTWVQCENNTQILNLTTPSTIADLPEEPNWSNILEKHNKLQCSSS